MIQKFTSETFGPKIGYQSRRDDASKKCRSASRSKCRRHPAANRQAEPCFEEVERYKWRARSLPLDRHCRSPDGGAKVYRCCQAAFMPSTGMEGLERCSQWNFMPGCDGRRWLKGRAGEKRRSALGVIATRFRRCSRFRFRRAAGGASGPSRRISVPAWRGSTRSCQNQNGHRVLPNPDIYRSYRQLSRGKAKETLVLQSATPGDAILETLST